MNEKKYVKAVGKRLTCTSKKKKEIMSMLTDELINEENDKASMRELIQKLGTPAQTAASYNEGFSESEVRKGKKERIIKSVGMILTILFVLGLLISWIFPKTKDISESTIYSKEEIESRTETIISLLDQSEYDTLSSQYCGENLAAALTTETLENAKAHISDEWGSRVSIGNMYIAEINQMGKTSAIVQVNVSYENASVTYTISYDKNMKLIGLYMK